MKRFKLKEIWTLLRWILLYEILLGVVVTVINLLFDLEEFYKSISITSFFSYEIFTLFFLVIVELLGISQLYLYWYKKYGLVKISKKDILKKIIDSGEGKRIEFKKSLRWDCERNYLNKYLEKSVLKTIAGFLNADGGNLIIGVSDKKDIEGLERDYQTLPKKNKDGFENYLTQIIRSHIGSHSLRLISISFTVIDEKEICYIRVKHSEDPVFYKHKGNEEFFVRAGNSTASLSISESLNYIKNHWKLNTDNIVTNS